MAHALQAVDRQPAVLDQGCLRERGQVRAGHLQRSVVAGVQQDQLLAPADLHREAQCVLAAPRQRGGRQLRVAAWRKFRQDFQFVRAQPERAEAGEQVQADEGRLHRVGHAEGDVAEADSPKLQVYRRGQSDLRPPRRIAGIDAEAVPHLQSHRLRCAATDVGMGGAGIDDEVHLDVARLAVAAAADPAAHHGNAGAIGHGHARARRGRRVQGPLARPSGEGLEARPGHRGQFPAGAQRRGDVFAVEHAHLFHLHGPATDVASQQQVAGQQAAAEVHQLLSGLGHDLRVGDARACPTGRLRQVAQSAVVTGASCMAGRGVRLADHGQGAGIGLHHRGGNAMAVARGHVAGRRGACRKPGQDREHRQSHQHLQARSCTGGGTG
ncbi:hypothetical protein [Pseudoxanthomonas sp. SGT-18]|uniref:hypothetical protein n=1 Tax=Pseudoxanthomonas sp. SGT-18 TaxID=2493087 RepID=UPI001F0B9C17|nr:hypothetical protein [Pseudoxanthomonas sp. SGT-18]